MKTILLVACATCLVLSSDLVYAQQRQGGVAIKESGATSVSDCSAAWKRATAAIAETEKRSDQLLMRIVGASVKEWKEHNGFTAEKAERRSLENDAAARRRERGAAHTKCLESVRRSSKNASPSSPTTSRISSAELSASRNDSTAPRSLADGSYSAWTEREKARKEREAIILAKQESAIATIRDEDQRMRETTRAAEELDQIYRERMRDKKPSRDDNTKSSYQSAAEDLVGESLKKGIEFSFKTFDSALARDQRKAADFLQGMMLERYRRAVGETRTFVGNLGGVAKRWAYFVSTERILSGETDEERAKETVGLLKEIAKEDVVPQVEKRLEVVLGRMFGDSAKTWIAASGGPAAFGAKVGADVLTSTELGRDAIWSVRDTSGRTTLTQKKEALNMLWKQYEKDPARWGANGEHLLLELSSTVYWQSAATERR